MKLPLFLCFVPVLFSSAMATELSPNRVMENMKRVADWQLAHPSKHPITDWTQAPFILGLLELYRVSRDPLYLEAVKTAGEKTGWKSHVSKRYVAHADDHAILAAWMAYDKIAGTKEGTENAVKEYAKVRAELKDWPVAALAGGTFTWCWCDALFMSPPVWTELSRSTKNPEYLAWSDHEWWTTTDVLFDPSEGLYYRDNIYFDKRTANGRKVFWSRGNGWVVSGVTRVLDHLPEDHPSRNRYLGVYKDLMDHLLILQNKDGLWRSNLLEPDEGPGESSGSAFILQGIAWGLNRDLLDEKKFRPALSKGWVALCHNIQSDGQLGFVQEIAAAPGSVSEHSTEVYGSGAFLLAGAEVLRTLDATKRRPDLISFQGVKLPAHGYQRATPEVKVRFVPERSDDFAFENDLVAFRAYGPALRSAIEDSGIDVWFKRVSWPVMDKWYIEDRVKLKNSGEAKTYHADHGEGYDAYKVADSRGCGGIGLWNGKSIHKSDTFVAHRIIKSTPELAIFELDYASEMEGKKVLETKRFSLALGERTYSCESRFSIDGTPGIFDVAIGLKPQSQKPQIIKKENSLVVWETFEGNKFGQAIVVDAKPEGFITESGPNGEPVQELILAKTDREGRISWRAGFAWEGQGHITTKEQWLAYVQNIRKN